MSDLTASSPLPTHPARRRWRVGAVLLVLLVPLAASVPAAASAPAPRVRTELPSVSTASGAATRVFMKLDRRRITTTQRARVRVALSRRSAGTSTQGTPATAPRGGLGSGRVKVLAQGPTTRTVRARLVRGTARVVLPRLPQGTYRVRATVLGQGAGTMRSSSRTLRVVGASGSGWPDASNTGVPDGVTLTPYGGPCTITADHTVIDAKSVTCALSVQAQDVVIKNSSLTTVLMDQDLMHARGESGWSFTLTDSNIDGGTTDGPGVCCGNYRVLRVEMRGGHNGAQCENGASYCDLTDSWIHGQYEPADGLRHLGGFLNDGGTPSTLVHNSITCDAPAENDEGGCTGDVNLIPNFGVMADVTVEHNLLGANANSAYCTYGGATPGLEDYAAQSRNIVYRDNVFVRSDTIADPAAGQPGSTNRCAAYGPVVGFDVDAPGNVWTGNAYDDGTAIICSTRQRCD